jgi:hypothetical protein
MSVQIGKLTGKTSLKCYSDYVDIVDVRLNKIIVSVLTAAPFRI